MPWHSRPERDDLWYNLQRADILARTGSLDDLHQEYPATDIEALSPRTLDKRIPAPWLEASYRESTPIYLPAAPPLEGLEIYKPPAAGRQYVIGCDPAEGNPTSDDSALEVVDLLTGEEAAALAGKYEPDVIAAHADVVGRYYNDAPVLVERNNHGHSVLLWLKDHSKLRVLAGKDDKPGWLNNSLGKTLLYNECAQVFKDAQLDDCILLHSELTYFQLASIEGFTLLAPKGQHDDRADAFALALVARALSALASTALHQAPVRGRATNPAMATARREVRR